MKLSGLSYYETDWKLDITTFHSVNLLVGKNASGKSRTIAAIVKMAGFLADKVKLRDSDVMYGTLVFQIESNSVLGYSFAWEKGRIIKEELCYHQEKPIISRDADSAIIKGESINPPQDKLVAHIRRDVQRYPEIEQIMLWASNVVSISFTSLGEPIDPYMKLPMANDYELTKLVLSLTDESKQEFYSLASRVGYNITEVSAVENYPVVLYREEGVLRRLMNVDLSTGMNRALTILLYMVYFRQMGCPALLVVDDLCEGLDYDRSVRLGKEVYSFCEKNNIQLLATSNDAFLMDVVDINNWSVLLREGTNVKVLNRATHQTLFDDFKFTGLSNFDFFSSDYIPNYLSKHPEV